MINLRKSTGQSVVETALLLPVILLILCAIFEFGRIFNAALIVTNASREGARRAVVGASDTEIISAVNSSAATLESSAMRISITPARTSRVPGGDVSVRIDYNVRLVTPLISSILPNPFPVSSRTVMRFE